MRLIDEKWFELDNWSISMGNGYYDDIVIQGEVLD